VSTENVESTEQVQLGAHVILDELVKAASRREEDRAAVDRWARAFLITVEEEVRARLRKELESRFKPEARKMDRFVDGWLSAAEYLTKEPGL
jgi:predicted kinase